MLHFLKEWWKFIQIMYWGGGGGGGGGTPTLFSDLKILGSIFQTQNRGTHCTSPTSLTSQKKKKKKKIINLGSKERGGGGFEPPYPPPPPPCIWAWSQSLTLTLGGRGGLNPHIPPPPPPPAYEPDPNHWLWFCNTGHSTETLVKTHFLSSGFKTA